MIETSWLRCPNCFSDLELLEQRVLGCATGHRYDLAKHGHATLLPPRAPRTVGDDREMLLDRDALLQTGIFLPIVDALMQLAQPVDDSTAPTMPRRIADLGCGTGYYGAHIAEQSSSSTTLLFADRSTEAVRMALRAASGASGVVLDIWRPLPLRDSSVDLALNVFAPRNAAEFARILSPDGALLVVVPTENHLAELQERGAVLEVPDGKAERVEKQFALVGLDCVARRRVEYQATVSELDRSRIIGMGPSAHHHSGIASDELDGSEPSRLSVSVDVLQFRHHVSARVAT